jgi:O-antigen biosynthesis protein WbqV
MKKLLSFGPRVYLIALHDMVATAAAVLASFYLRFENQDLLARLPVLAMILPYFLALSVIVCASFRLTTTKWRFISFPDVLNIIRVASVLTVALLVLDYIFLAPNVYGTFFLGKTTIILYWFLQVAFLAGPRFAYRYFRYTRTLRAARNTDAASVLILGRTADAEVLIRSIESGAVKQIWPVGILSPSRADRGQSIRGIPVLGSFDDLANVVGDFEGREKPIERVVMTPSALAPDLHPEDVLLQSRKLGLTVNRMPSLDESSEPPRLAPIAVEDLLLRPSVSIDYRRLESLVKGKAVAVTGGGGSIGSEICRRMAAFGATRLLIIEHSEKALYDICEALAAEGSQMQVEGRIADIRDAERIQRLMAAFRPDIVFHAAALKHVPILEHDWAEGVKTNIFGSINVADAALASGAKAMVMISTDKAIEPVSMLGLTKRFAEMYCQALDRDVARRDDTKNGMRLISVRFGNVLASNGSVVPKFKAQIEAGGPVTVTHPDMVRYFMTIREACDLVVSAASHATGTDERDVSVYVLNMGQPVKIVDLAERMIRLSGLVPGEDIEIVFTGIRPGERLHEILFATQEPTTETGIAGVMAARPNEPALTTVRNWTAALRHAVERDDRDTIRGILRDAIPEFSAEAAQ